MIMRCRDRNKIIINARRLSEKAKAVAFYQNETANEISNPVHGEVE